MGIYTQTERFILNLFNNALPRPMRNAIKHILAYPSVFCAARAIIACCERLSNSYTSRYQVENAAFIDNFPDYESLFQDSERNFETFLSPYTSEFRWFFGRIYNTWFASIDSELYYSMIRRYEPNLIIEIGSGHSTYFAVDALSKNQAGRIISIDPDPRISLPGGVAHIQARVEHVGMDVFTELRKNDILFIDSSHTTEEARYHCEQILPNIHTGVLIHHHDFSYPYRVYINDDAARYGEPDVLLQFYTDNRESFEVVVCASYIRYKNLELLNRLVRSYRWNPGRIPSSLWTKKKTPRYIA